VDQRINLKNDDNAIYFNFLVISSTTADAAVQFDTDADEDDMTTVW